MSQSELPRFKAKDIYDQGIVVAIRDPINILDHEFFLPSMKARGELLFPELKGYVGQRIDKSLAPWDQGNFRVKVTEWVDKQERVVEDWHVVDYNAPEFTFIDKDAKVVTNKMRWVYDENGKPIPTSNRRKSKFFATGTVPVFTGEPVFISSTGSDGKRAVEYVDQFAIYLKGRVMQAIYRLASKDEEDFGEVPKLMYVQFTVEKGPNGDYVNGVNRIDEKMAMKNWKKNHEKYPDLLPKKPTESELDQAEAILSQI